jgi:hypothetical protein
MIRLIRASGDYISQYHEETREAYARSDVDFEYRQDEYHRHWATSIGETFEFHTRAFANAALNNVPVSWSHSNPYRKFSVYGYDVESTGQGPAIVYLHDVRQGGFRVTTRKWAPDGPAASRTIRIQTAPVYAAGKQYVLIDRNLATGQERRSEVTADAAGRLTVSVDGQGHQISFAGPGTGSQPPVVLPLTSRDLPRLDAGHDLDLPLRIYNPRADAMKDVRVRLTSAYPTVEVTSAAAAIPEVASGKDVSAALRIRLTAGAGYYAPAVLNLAITYDGYQTVTENIPILIGPEVIDRPRSIRFSTDAP